MLKFTRTSYSNPAVADVLLEDDRLVEINDDSNILRDWRAGEHVDESQRLAADPDAGFTS
jgi:hypothetical protein